MTNTQGFILRDQVHVLLLDTSNDGTHDLKTPNDLPVNHSFSGKRTQMRKRWKEIHLGETTLHVSAEKMYIEKLSPLLMWRITATGKTSLRICETKTKSSKAELQTISKTT